MGPRYDPRHPPPPLQRELGFLRPVRQTSGLVITKGPIGAGVWIKAIARVRAREGMRSAPGQGACLTRFTISEEHLHLLIEFADEGTFPGPTPGTEGA